MDISQSKVSQIYKSHPPDKKREKEEVACQAESRSILQVQGLQLVEILFRYSPFLCLIDLCIDVPERRRALLNDLFPDGEVPYGFQIPAMESNRVFREFPVCEVFFKADDKIFVHVLNGNIFSLEEVAECFVSVLIVTNSSP